jgi:tetratricopeptide (TPR) repeat protein
MAKKRKRLNKKVALIGSLVLAVFLLGVVVVVLRFSKNPQKFLADAEVALAQYDYEGAEVNYRQAYGCAKDDDLKIEILFKIADLHLIDDEVHEHEPDWLKVIGCWNTAITIDPKNTKARMFLLKYFYEVGDSGNPGAWQTVESTASELAQIIDEKLEKPDTYVLLAKARAKLEMASFGQTSDREKTLAEAVAELEQLKELAPENIDIYKYLARAETIQGEIDSSKGLLGAAQKAAEKAEEILQRAVDMSPDNPEVYINLLDMKFKSVWGEVGADWRDSEKVQALQKEFESLVHKFGSNAKAYVSLARFYQLDIKDIDKAVETIEKAVELDSQDINGMMIMAGLYYRKFSIYGDEQFLTKAIETANNALNLPGARDVQGPRQFLHRRHRYVLFSQLADWYVEQAFEAGLAGDEQEKGQWTRKAEDAIHEIEQFVGTGDNVYIVKWHGLLELIKGNTTTAIRQMFTAYEQLKAANQRNATLSYMLARVFEDRAEIGARQEFLENALLKRPSIALQKPEAMLDYAEVLLQLRATAQVMVVVDAYEKGSSVSDRSKRIRVRGYIQDGRFDDAEAYLAQIEPDAVDTIELRLSLIRSRINRITASKRKKEANLDEQQQAAALREQPVTYRRQLKNLRERLLEKKPKRLITVLALCKDYVADGQVEKARSTIDKYLAHSPDDTSAQLYKRGLSEPDPIAISQDRLNEMSEEIIANIPDELERSITLGQHYQSLGLLEKAMAEYKKAYARSPDEKRVVAVLFDIALLSEDMVLAEELVQQARNKNLDDCEGNLFAARLDMVKGDSQSALGRLNDCLKARPVFANGYLLRSQVNGDLGNYEEAVSDIEMARRFNPLDKVIARRVAAVLYNRNLRLGTNVSSEQITETEQALGRAILLNTDDWNLRSIYAEYISEREPAKALAMRQLLVGRFPNVDNNLMLGNMAMRMAVKETDKERRTGLLDIARSGYEKAYEMAPTEKRVRKGYSEYLRRNGQRDKATELFDGMDDELWRYYLRDGQYDKARKILEKLYKDETENVPVVRSLSIIAAKTDDKEALIKYSQELMTLENTTENQLVQIQSYLEAGLVKEAELKLESFRERYPDEPKGILLEAWSSMTKGQLKQALEYVNQSLEITPENAVAWRLRGQINRLLGEFERAVEDLQKSKSISNRQSDSGDR